MAYGLFAADAPDRPIGSAGNQLFAPWEFFLAFFLFLLLFFFSTFFEKFLQEYHLSVKQIGSISGPTFLSVQSVHKNYPQTTIGGKELRVGLKFTILFKLRHLHCGP